MAHDSSVASDLVESGVPQLDTVLGGGLPRGGLVMVLGPPGSGKTILSSQVAFAAARAGRRALLLTALSESTTKLVRHLHAYAFFDEAALGDRIHIFSLQDVLANGLRAVETAIVAEAVRLRVDLLVLDGFRGVVDVQQSVQSVRALLYDLSTRLGLQGTTTIVASESDPRDPAMFPETTTADVIIGLYYELAGVRGRRGVEVVKMRGSAPLPGRHGLSLDETGAVVYPRLEARVADSPRRGPRSAVDDGAHDLAGRPAPSTRQGRASFGLSELDALLGGGLTSGTSTLLTGSIGVGKTLLALNFALEGVRRNEPTLFLGFRETAEQLLAKAGAFAIGAQLRAGLLGGGLSLLRWEPVELDADVVGHHLIAALDRTRARRLVIDSIAELEHAVVESSGADRVPNFMAALLAALRARGVTLLALREAPKAVTQYLEISTDALSVLAENVLHLQEVTVRNEVRRVLTVVKMRFSAFDRTLREFRIAPPDSFTVVGPAETGADVLLEIAQQYGFTAGLRHETPDSGSTS